MNYRVCVVEDNREHSDRLVAFLGKYSRERGKEFNVSVYGDALSFLGEFCGNFDLIFMDIELPYRNGMDVVKQIREKDKKVIVVFVTNMAQYAVKGYEVDAFDFIVKPIHYSAFAIKLDRALERLGNDARQRDLDKREEQQAAASHVGNKICRSASSQCDLSYYGRRLHHLRSAKGCHSAFGRLAVRAVQPLFFSELAVRYGARGIFRDHRGRRKTTSLAQ